MKDVVLDCSVVVPWFFPEKDSRHASSMFREFKEGGFRALAPALLQEEFGNAAWKKVQQKKCAYRDALKQIKNFAALPIVYYPTEDMLTLAFELACKESLTLYDSLYMFLALRLKASIASFDKHILEAAESLKIEIY